MGSDAASETWITVLHPEYPISFEVPENYSKPADRRPLRLGEPRDRAATSGVPTPLERSLTWGVRPVERSKTDLFAIQTNFIVLTNRFEGVDSGTVSSLRGAAPLDLLRFYRGVLVPKELAHVEFSEPRRIDIGNCAGARISAKQWSGPADQRYLMSFEVLIIPVPELGVLLGESYVASKATAAERDVIAPRILDSVQISLCRAAASTNR